MMTSCANQTIIGQILFEMNFYASLQMLIDE